MAMTSRMKDGKRQGITISSKLMADYLEKRAGKLKVVDQPIRKGWRHYPGMLYDFYRAFDALDTWHPWDLFIAFDAINGLAGIALPFAEKLCYAVDDKARPHNTFVAWLYRRLDALVRSHADIVLESSPNATRGILMPSLCPPLVEDHYKPKEQPIIGYLGALEAGFGVDKAILAMPHILESVPHASLEVVGGGSERPKLEKMAEGLPIKFYGFLPDEEAVEVVKRWMAGLAPYTQEMKGIDSGKIRFYAWSGVPSVISTEAPRMVELVERFTAGIASRPEPKMIAGAIGVMWFSGLYYSCLDGCRRLAESSNSEAYFDNLFKNI